MRLSIKISLFFCILIFLLFFINIKYQICPLNFHQNDNSCHRFRVLTWNIHCSEGACKEREEQIARTLIDINADVIQLNEYNIDSCIVLDSIIKTKYNYSHLKDSHEPCGNAIYSKLSLHKQGSLYAKVENGHASMMSINILFQNEEINIIGLHLPSNSGDGSAVVQSIDSLYRIFSFYAQYKRNQIQRNTMISIVKQSLETSKAPAIVLGDFNDFSSSAPIDSLRDIGMKDSWWEGGLGYGTTFHLGLMRLRIDHIIHSPELKLCEVKIYDTNLSDHNPVMASFSLNNE